MKAQKIVDNYLTAFYEGDFETARQLVSDDFSFRGPFVTFDGADAFLASATPLRSFVRGHRVLRQWSDGAEVCTIYEIDLETPVGRGAVPMVEWNRIVEDKIVSARLIFDTAEFRKLMPMAGGRS